MNAIRTILLLDYIVRTDTKQKVKKMHRYFIKSVVNGRMRRDVVMAIDVVNAVRKVEAVIPQGSIVVACEYLN